MEDAISIASCLQLGGKSNAAIATKIHNRLRYERISCWQMMSFVNTQQHHFTDWSLIAKDPKMIRTRFPKWVSLPWTAAVDVTLMVLAGLAT